MIDPILLRKVLREILFDRGRTLLVVLNIAVGVTAFGMILAALISLEESVSVSQRQHQTASVQLILNQPADDEVIQTLRRMPEVKSVSGASRIIVRWKAAETDDWQNGYINMIDNYQRQQVDLLRLVSGSYPSLNRIAIENTQSSAFGVPPLGSTLWFQVEDTVKALEIMGSLYDANQVMPPLATYPTFYVDRDTFQQLGGIANYSIIKLTTAAPYSETTAFDVGNLVRDRLEKHGVTTASIITRDPMRHALSDIIDGLGFILRIIGLAALLLSAILVTNTINTTLARQTSQIGIIKTVGGQTLQVGMTYLWMVMIYALMAIALAIPLSIVVSNAIAEGLMQLLNVPSMGFRIIPQILVLQIVVGFLIPIVASLFPIRRGTSVTVRNALDAQKGSIETVSGGFFLRIDRIFTRLFSPWMVLVLRNTLRHPLRIFMTQIVLVTAGVLFITVTSAQYTFDQSIERALSVQNFDVIFTLREAYDTQRLRTILQNQQGVVTAEVWNNRIGVYRSSDRSQEENISITAAPLDSRLYRPEVVAGRALEPTAARELLLNETFAQDYGFKIGDAIQLDFGNGNQDEWKIVGLVFDVGPIGIGTRTAFVNLDVLGRDLSGQGTGSVVYISTTQHDSLFANAMETTLRKLLIEGGIQVEDSMTQIRNREVANSRFSIITTLLLVMTVMVTAVGGIALSGMLSINVIERRREIGVLRSIGATSTDINSMYIAEGVFFGLICWLNAVGLSNLFAPMFIVNLMVMVDFVPQYYFSTVSVVLWLITMLLIAIFAAWLPARHASKISVHDSLAYDG